MNESAEMVQEIAKGLGERGHILKCVDKPDIQDAPEITIVSKSVILIYFFFSSSHLYHTSAVGEKWESEGAFKYCDPDFPDNLYKAVEDLISG